MSSTPNSKRRRPQEILLPDGKKVIVTVPDDLEKIRQKYANQNEIQVEVVVHGSHEHRSHLERSRDHHQSRKAELRERHGPAFDEWEDLHKQLDSVTAELERLQDLTAGLNASFNKFGYDAKLRTYDEDGSKTPTLQDTMSDAASSETGGSMVRLGQTTKLFKKPVIKQWFHRGLLWRASEHTEIMAVELFFDLLYVAIIHINGEHIAEDPTGFELLRFAITFIMSWKIWADITQTLSWFETDDVLTRFLILFEIACLLGFTTNMTYSFYEDESHNTYTQLVAFYLAARLKSAVYYVTTSFLLPMIRGVMITQAISIIVPSALWIGSIHLNMPARLGLVWVALFLDICGQWPITVFYRWGQQAGQGTRFGERLNKFFEFFPAMNIEHRVERTNAFVSLVFGYSVVGVIFQSYGGYNVNAFLGKAILGLVQAFIFNWIYFDIDGSNINLHAIRRSAISAVIWQYVHLPFIMGYIVASAGLSKLVLATDVPAAHIENLSSHYRLLVLDHVEDGIRFFYCHGLAIALLGMTVISLCHEHKRPPTLRWSKTTRLANRVAVCLVLFFLPMARSLRSRDLIAVSLGLTAWVLLLELWGKSCRDDPFIGEKAGCGVNYSARCTKKDLEEALGKDRGRSSSEERCSVDIQTLDRNEKTAVAAQD
ncbi:bacterial low temperature requirement A protein-domain-containing protein [Stachybotrys elegans]|uniref:Bacterial low temperature requirement A protein-domain-containing protein n=1 Tax=Stachybotrys elegans TaxID=80388 RepID=A0A8K0WS57_9HYPO|nr:bacterial low temperature requirement A protein-domain-containing protein [Stachybotrys elegans]